MQYDRVWDVWGIYTGQVQAGQSRGQWECELPVGGGYVIDRGFRSVGYQYSDAGKTPKRKHITYKTRRKLKSKNLQYCICVTNDISP
jgi:hypothetical protein